MRGSCNAFGPVFNTVEDFPPRYWSGFTGSRLLTEKYQNVSDYIDSRLLSSNSHNFRGK